MATHRCSTCGNPFEAEGNVHTPFCSRRCQQVDLGHWLDERYGLPWEDAAKEPEPDGEPDEPGPGDQNRDKD